MMGEWVTGPVRMIGPGEGWEGKDPEFLLPLKSDQTDTSHDQFPTP